MFWKAMDMFEEQSRVPVRMTYRAVGSSTGQKEFLGIKPDKSYDVANPHNHFAAGDIPAVPANLVLMRCVQTSMWAECLCNFWKE